MSDNRIVGVIGQPLHIIGKVEPSQVEIKAQIIGTGPQGPAGLEGPQGPPGEVSQAEFDALSQEFMSHKTDYATLKGVNNGAVTYEKTDFITKYLGKNLFDKSTVTPDMGVNGTNGTLLKLTGYSASDYIQVEPNTTYTRNYVHAIAFYDKDKIFISGATSDKATETFTTPNYCKYIRVTISNLYIDMMQLEVGEVKTTYEPYIENYKIDNLVIDPITPDKATFLMLSEKNMFDRSTVTINKAVNGNTGELFDVTGYSASSYIPVKPEATYSRNHIHAIAFYDKDKIFISGATSDKATETFTTPSNCAYIRLSVPNNLVDTLQLEEGLYTTAYEPYRSIYNIDEGKIKFKSMAKNYWEGKKVIWNGDSITEGWYNASVPGYEDGVVPFPKLVADAMGMKSINYGIGGSTIGVYRSSDYLKDGIPADPISDKNRTPIVLRFGDMTNDADLVVIAGGTNDWYYQWGLLGDINSRDNQTFYGALHNLCIGLIEKYSGKQILFLTPIKRLEDPAAINEYGKSLKDYSDIIKEVCCYYSIPVLDMYSECMLNPHIESQKTAYIPDAVHPNQAGHNIISRRIIGYLKQLA